MFKAFYSIKNAVFTRFKYSQIYLNSNARWPQKNPSYFVLEDQNSQKYSNQVENWYVSNLESPFESLKPLWTYEKFVLFKNYFELVALTLRYLRVSIKIIDP